MMKTLTQKIAEMHDPVLNTTTDKYGYATQLVENTKVLCIDDKMVIPKSLQHHAERQSNHMSKMSLLSGE